MKAAESWLEQKMHYRFLDAQLFEQAITHRSVGGHNNERLEFLGDAVLNFVISDIIYRVRADASEGDLSKLRASLVKDESLAKLALELDLGEHIILGGGERKSGGDRRESILADTLEAIFGAIFLDQGLAAIKAVIETVYDERIRNLPDVNELRDSKTRLQEWLQARRMNLPAYELVSVSGKDHNKRFEISCTVVEHSALTHGNSTTRRKAEQEAAKAMLERITEEQW